MSLREWVLVGAGHAVSITAVLGAATLILEGCAGGSEAPPSAAVSSTPTPATSAAEPSTTTKAEPEPKPDALLEDGRHFGYIESAALTSARRELVFDLAYFLSGEEANAAAAKRGQGTPVPNDYFVVNDNSRLRTLSASPELVIDLVDWKRCCEQRFVADAGRFETALTSSEWPPGRYKGRFTAYWVSVEDGGVIRIEEQYLP